MALRRRLVAIACLLAVAPGAACTGEDALPESSLVSTSETGSTGGSIDPDGPSTRSAPNSIRDTSSGHPPMPSGAPTPPTRTTSPGPAATEPVATGGGDSTDGDLGAPFTAAPERGVHEHDSSFLLRQLLYRIGIEQYYGDHNVGERSEFQALLGGRWFAIAQAGPGAFKTNFEHVEELPVDGVDVTIGRSTITGFTAYFACDGWDYEIAATAPGAARFDRGATETEHSVAVAEIVINDLGCHQD